MKGEPMKNKYKVITHTQLEEVLQIIINRITSGKPSYSYKEVLAIINLIYNTLLQSATRNAEAGMYIQQVENDPIN